MLDGIERETLKLRFVMGLFVICNGLNGAKLTCLSRFVAFFSLFPLPTFRKSKIKNLYQFYSFYHEIYFLLIVIGKKTELCSSPSFCIPESRQLEF